MFNLSKKLEEYSENLSPIYTDDHMNIYSIPNYSKDKILCFGVEIFKNKDRQFINNKYCRISMTDHKYIGAEGEDLVLNKEQIEQVIKALNSNHSIFKNSTCWETLIFFQNKEHEYEDDWIELEYFNMPDYRKLLRRNY